MTEADRYLEEKLRRKNRPPPEAVPPYAPGSAPHKTRFAPPPGLTPDSSTFPGWFTCEGRLPRGAYFMRFVVIFPVALFGFGLAATVPVLGLPLIVLTFVLLIPQTAKRLHDMDQSGWLQLLTVIPLVHLWILFAQGTDGPNQYGPKPA